MDLTIYIPTRGRIGLTTQITLRDMKMFSTLKPWIVCPAEEEKWHKNYYSQVLVSPIEGIAEKRQWIIEQCPTRGVVMLDDDLYFSYRTQPEIPETLDRIKNLDPMFQWMSEQLDAGFVHGGISARQGNQNIEGSYTDCIRCMNVHFIDREVYMKLGVRYDLLRVMEDFYVTLSLLTKGYPNRVGYQWCWNQRGGGTKGGCSLYRTPELQEDCALTLMGLFPRYVKAVEKESHSQKGVMAKRMDVNVQWVKAWKDEGWLNRAKRVEQGEHIPEPRLQRR